MYNLYIMTMVRKQIYLEKKQDDAIKREAKRRRVSEAEVIRTCIEQGLDDAEARESRRLAVVEELISDLRARAASTPSTTKPYKFSHDDTYDDPLERAAP